MRLKVESIEFETKMEIFNSDFENEYVHINFQ